jgi:hypothetical protein
MDAKLWRSSTIISRPSRRFCGGSVTTDMRRIEYDLFRATPSPVHWIAPHRLTTLLCLRFSMMAGPPRPVPLWQSRLTLVLPFLAATTSTDNCLPSPRVYSWSVNEALPVVSYCGAHWVKSSPSQWRQFHILALAFRGEIHQCLSHDIPSKVSVVVWACG